MSGECGDYAKDDPREAVQPLLLKAQSLEALDTASSVQSEVVAVTQQARRRLVRRRSHAIGQQTTESVKTGKRFSAFLQGWSIESDQPFLQLCQRYQLTPPSQSVYYRYLVEQYGTARALPSVASL